MSDLTEQVRHGAEQALTSLSQGRRELKDRASGALTHFQPTEDGSPGRTDSEMPSLTSWGFMAADVGDSKDSVVVRLEAPGMSRSCVVRLSASKATSGSSENSKAKATERFNVPMALSGEKFYCRRR